MHFQQFVINTIRTLVILFFLKPLYSGTTGKIAGRITDENNNPLIGCNVIIKGTSLGAASDLDGKYFILNIPPGVYEISSSMIGYGTVTITGVQVIVDLTAKADFTLNTETIEGEEITVTAEKPTVRLDPVSYTHLTLPTSRSV